ncbi:MAG TPA: glycosyltransferase family 2 protein [Actinophytocola sp.]|uniref:glycosyltransferase family 2 protein n=1 Tax=Actinophytocola sp. TaxID=1872138 RepID=UPI002E09DDF6|nr:glycosyltransferase family 2 protein [Actinophytocola sp.]
MPTEPRIAVVIVTYNSADVLAGCLEALKDGARGVRLTDVVVADNASADESLRIAKEATGIPIRTVQLGRNAGYAAGFNAGVATLSDYDAVLLLNPDCRLRPGTLAVLAQALTVGKRGMVAPKLLNTDGTLQPTLRRTPTVRGTWAEALIGGRRAGRPGGPGELVFDEAAHDRPGRPAWVTGCALLMSAACLAGVGPWDESFLLYSEETEFIFRAADQGWTLWYEPAAVVEHIGGESATHPGLAALLVVNKVKLFRRRNGRLRSAAYFGGVLACQALRALLGNRPARTATAWLLRPSRRITTLDQL